MYNTSCTRTCTCRCIVCLDEIPDSHSRRLHSDSTVQVLPFIRFTHREAKRLSTACWKAHKHVHFLSQCSRLPHTASPSGTALLMASSTPSAGKCTFFTKNRMEVNNIHCGWNLIGSTNISAAVHKILLRVTRPSLSHFSYVTPPPIINDGKVWPRETS